MESLISDSYRIDRWDDKHKHWSIARAVLFGKDAAQAEFDAMCANETTSRLRLVVVKSVVLSER